MQMRMAAVNLSPSLPSLINSRKFPRSTRFVVDTFRVPRSSNHQRSLRVQTPSKLPSRAWRPLSSTAVSADLPLIRPWSGLPARLLDTRAKTALERVEEEEKSPMKPFELGSLFGLCYLCSVYFNIYKNQLAAFLPLPIAFTIRNIVTNMILGKIFNRTIKAIDPLLCDVLSVICYVSCRFGSFLPVVYGVVLASMTMASFNGARYLSAIGWNWMYQSDEPSSEKVMVKQQKYLGSITLFLIIMIMSYFLLPVTTIPKDLTSAVQGTGFRRVNVKQLCTNLIISSFFVHVVQTMLFQISKQKCIETHDVVDYITDMMDATVGFLMPSLLSVAIWLTEPTLVLPLVSFLSAIFLLGDLVEIASHIRGS